MKMKTDPGAAYLRFLTLSEALRQSPTLPMLDPLEERLLVLIACEGQDGERLSVRDVIERKELGSPAMLHRRLTFMREKGWIMLNETEDARRKQISLSQAALLHFEKLSKCLIQAASEYQDMAGLDLPSSVTTASFQAL